MLRMLMLGMSHSSLLIRSDGVESIAVCDCTDSGSIMS
jgi:hypothetical protein